MRARNARIAAEAAVIALELPIALTGLSLEFGGEHLVAHAHCVDVDALPGQSVTLLQSGKASGKPLATARRLAADIVKVVDAPNDLAAFFAPSNAALFVRWTKGISAAPVGLVSARSAHRA